MNTFVNGILYSILSLVSMKEKALEIGLDEILKYQIQNSTGDLKAQWMMVQVLRTWGEIRAWSWSTDQNRFILRGTNKRPDPTPLIGHKYRIQKKFDEGMYGEISLACLEGVRGSDDASNRVEFVVVKKISKKRSDEQKLRAEEEAGRLLKHRGLVHFRETFESNQWMYFILDYISGKSLYACMEERNFPPMPELEVRHLFAQMVDAVLNCGNFGEMFY